MKNTLKAVVFLLSSTFFQSAVGFAQSETPVIKKEKFHSHKEIEESIGYTQAIKVGNMVYISGMTSAGDADVQIKNVYESLQEVLASYGLSFHHVVKENLYSTDIESIKTHLELRKTFYKGDYPAATWLEVNALFDPSAKLEVELIAVLP